MHCSVDWAPVLLLQYYMSWTMAPSLLTEARTIGSTSLWSSVENPRESSVRGAKLLKVSLFSLYEPTSAAYRLALDFTPSWLAGECNLSPRVVFALRILGGQYVIQITWSSTARVESSGNMINRKLIAENSLQIRIQIFYCSDEAFLRRTSYSTVFSLPSSYVMCSIRSLL